ncbi:MAG: RNA pseudouridine synthase [Alphaproteobacteria bacterium]|nr:RNA pseudouridine synthase [Alphaproteobacteria bacterium]
MRSTERALKPSTTLRPEEQLGWPCPSSRRPRRSRPARRCCTRTRGCWPSTSPRPADAPRGAGFTWGLINLAREAFPEEELHLAHRLDRETSGVCLIARDAESNRLLKAAFKTREAQKRYLAVVRGSPDWERACWPHRRRRGLAHPPQAGACARTGSRR